MANFVGTENADNLDGTIFSDTLEGKNGNDTLTARAGVDHLDGGPGVDKMFGGSGGDFFVVHKWDAAPGEIYDGGSGSDELDVVGAGIPYTADFSQSTITSIEFLSFFFSDSAPLTAHFKGASFGGSGFSSDLFVTGSVGTDILAIDMLGDTFIDLSGLQFRSWSTTDRVIIVGTSDNNETIIGSPVADSIQPGQGIDVVHAGGGDDIINANRTSTGEIYDGGTGFDTLVVSDPLLPANLTTSTLLGIESVRFDFTNAGTFIRAVLLASQFGGGGVSSTLLVQSVDPNADELIIDLGTETVFSAANFTFDGFGPEDIVRDLGSPGNDSITGSSHNDDIDGGAGQDVLIAGAGDDVLRGGIGSDFMFGGAGDDLYQVFDTGDVAAEVLIGTDPGGHDLVIAGIDAILNSFIEDLTLVGNADIDGTGNNLANVITGNVGANVLRGLGGADRLIGGADIDSLFGGGGADRFIFNDITDSGVGSGNRDRIEDFAGGDKIQLSGIDADETVGGNQAFALDTDGSFSTGEIKLTINGANTIVAINTDADATAEMQIVVVGVTNLAAENFIL